MEMTSTHMTSTHILLPASVYVYAHTLLVWVLLPASVHVYAHMLLGLVLLPASVHGGKDDRKINYLIKKKDEDGNKTILP